MKKANKKKTTLKKKTAVKKIKKSKPAKKKAATKKPVTKKAIKKKSIEQDDVEDDLIDEENVDVDIEDNVPEEKAIRRSPAKQHKNSIHTHIIDQAIESACRVFAAARTKIMNGNVKHFRIRYLRNNRKTKVMEIENQYIINGRITKINEMKMRAQVSGTNKLQDYKLETKQGVKLHYDTVAKKYTLIVHEDYLPEETSALPGTKAGADPGYRKFQTLMSDTEAVKIGSTMSEKISKRLRRIDAINDNDELTEKVKRKREHHHYEKICNMVDDMHWKTIKYMTDNYERIQMGVMNTQSIVGNANLNKMVKRVLEKMKHYTFRQRLKYKCEAKRVQYAEVDEKYTSKLCPGCGTYNDQKDKEIYKCELGCGLIMDRDMVGSKNILLKEVKNK